MTHSSAESMKPLPCPFCGSQPVTERTGFSLRAMYIYCINDNGCPRPKAVGESEEKAIESWNTRTPAQPASGPESLAVRLSVASRLYWISEHIGGSRGQELVELADMLTASEPRSEAENATPSMDIETIQILLDLLNPLHGELDRQTYDEKLREDFNTPSDYEHNVSITAQMERDLTQAVLILEDRKRKSCSPPGSITAKEYVDRAIASFSGDPPDNQFQRGYLAALEVVRDEAFSATERKHG